MNTSVDIGRTEPSEVRCSPGAQIYRAEGRSESPSVKPDPAIRTGGEGRTDDMKFDTINGQSGSSVVSPSSDSGVHSLDEQWECMSTYSGESDSIQSVKTVHGGVVCQADSPIVQLGNMDTRGVVFSHKGTYGKHDSMSYLSTNGHSDGMIERFNRTCLMMLSMFVNDRRDNWHELLPFIMHAYQTSVHESTGYSPFRLMMGEECSLPQDVSTAELRTQRENDEAPHPFATWVRDALEVAYDHVRSSLKKTASRRKRLYDTKAVNRKFPVGSWVLRYYPPAAQHKLGSPWVGPHQVVRQATGHTVGIQRDADKPIIFVHVDDLDIPIDLNGHILSPFYQRELNYQDCTFQSIAHL